MPNRVNIGQMDRYLIAQTKTETKSSKGQIVPLWVDSFSFFATQNDNVVSETFSTVQFVAPVSTTFLTHFRPDLLRTMRLKLDTDYWNIINIARDRIYMKIECIRMDE